MIGRCLPNKNKIKGEFYYDKEKCKCSEHR
jgi:hypothetical protein